MACRSFVRSVASGLANGHSSSETVVRSRSRFFEAVGGLVQEHRLLHFGFDPVQVFVERLHFLHNVLVVHVLDDELEHERRHDEQRLETQQVRFGRFLPFRRYFPTDVWTATGQQEIINRSQPFIIVIFFLKPMFTWSDVNRWPGSRCSSILSTDSSSISCSRSSTASQRQRFHGVDQQTAKYTDRSQRHPVNEHFSGCCRSFHPLANFVTLLAWLRLDVFIWDRKRGRRVFVQFAPCDEQHVWSVDRTLVI